MVAYTLTYDTQGATGEVPVGGSIEEGASVTLDDGSGLTKAGYNFGGWSTTVGGTPIEGTFTMPGADTTLYAVWVPYTQEQFLAECNRIINVCRNLIDSMDYEKGIPARVILRETTQDMIVGIRAGAPVKIRNERFDY